MFEIPKWTHDEMQQTSVDYASVEQVQRYDDVHQRFRDYEKDSDAIIKLLELDSNSTVIDMGAGTGAFALHAAKHCQKIYAMDVSLAMLNRCRKKGEEMGLSNILYCHGGFLTYNHEAEPADAMVSIAVLHHLPDFWKLVGLGRAAGMLKAGGRFFLFDIVFPSEATDLEDQINAWIRSIAERSGPELAAEAEIHIREEYSTYDWVMEGLLKRAGFEIESAEYGDGFQTTYVCTRR
ncbi:MAG: class I SAM-dependent methyltransferase [Euryarchaeota archaeon]|nr:MAG: Ubiquinone/menaquinone biosynthesis C-methyltransferase UbiE [ANME-2 cluster archaeon]MEA1863800.1 class I SAM-dependent methyltransferase [Euryarchaeota archaeon]